MNTDPSIFKTYDIRAIYPTQLDEEGAYAIARGYATLIQRENPDKKLTIAVGGDMRLSTPSLKEQVIKGLLDSGLNVVDVGLISTPTYYYTVGHFGYDGGVQVSASHNPAEYNGLKMVRAKGVPLSKDTGILAIRSLVESQDFIPLATESGQLEQKHHITEEMVKDQLKNIDVSNIKNFKIVLDPANAMGALDLDAGFGQIPAQLIKINYELDGTFPNHEADPLKEENLEQLQKKIIEEKADMGIATDGDGDRIFFVDEKGETLPPAILRGLMAQIALTENPGEKVAYDIRPGRITQDMIDEYGGTAVVTPVGHSLIKEMMLENDVVFGGESSGHYFYRLPEGTFEAPIILLAKFLKFITEQDKPISEIVTPLKKYSHSGEINTKVESREAVEQKIEQIKQKYSDGKQIFIDGVTVEYPDVWFNVRASNTEPLIRLTVEGRSEERMKEMRDDVLALIRD